MRNVKFLQLNYMKFYGSYEHFPKNLIWLCWHGFSLRSLPKHLCLEKVVVLDLSRSCLVDAWKGKPLENHQGHRFLQSDASVASTPSIITQNIGMVNAQIQPWIFQVTVLKGVFNVAVSDEDGMVKFYEEEEEEWIIQKEFVGHLSFQIASPAAHRICAFNLFIRFRTTRETRLRGSVNIEIRNNTSGRSLFCPASFFPSGYRHGNGVIQSLSHWKLGVEDPTFDNGDDVSISVLSLDPTIQLIKQGS
ncbi:hypothetical protein OIU74_006839 [Salix koriyanagi]|uniref:Uncharacterized protein n=1 Tax=Salix koriyanagi TaxID=2511006 RepID=A0A9Q0ZBX2_9ROSI|nr:hypothetical protein OIU74_006839 [Salix koriyanagi]